MRRFDNDNKPLRFLSVCSGIEAASVAWPMWQAVAFSEIEKFPSAVLSHHYPDVPNLGDFTKIDPTTLGQVDILCGGTPCQAFSVAGARQSLADARGNLTLAFVELAHELAGNRTTNGNGLRNVVWENVPGVLNTPDNAFGCFLAGIVGADDPLCSPDGSKWPDAGMVAGPRARAAWRILDAQYFGLAQRRRRVILVADFGSGADPAAVLFERKGLHGDTPPSREKGQNVAPTISARTKGGGGLGTDFDLDGGLVEHKQWPADIAPTLNAAFGDKQGLEDQHALNGAGLFVPSVQVVHGTQDPCDGGDKAFALGRNSGQENVIAWSIMPQNSGKDYKARQVEIAQPLMAGGPVGGNQGGDYIQQPVSVALRGREGGATAELGGEIATALRASQGGGDKPHVLTECRPINTMVGLRHKALGERTGLGIGGDGDPSYTLTKGHSHAVQIASAVRRLTPIECERLQGFPDDYTNIPWRGKPTSPDGPRYKALGNSWAVPLFHWLGERINRLMPPIGGDTNRDSQHAA